MKYWVQKTIGELCDAGGGQVKTGPFGSQLHQSDYQDSGTPVVMPADIINGKIDQTRIAHVSQRHVDRLHKHKLSKGDIIYGRRGDIGRQAIIRDNNAGWLCGTGCLRITLNKATVVPEFLHLYLSLPDVIGWIQNQAIGATMPNLNTSILRRVPVWHPAGKLEQKKIASVIFAYDDLIESNKHRIAILEKMAEDIYREWFVRMRFPGHEEVKFRKGVPEGWEEKRFNKFCMLKRGYDLPNRNVIEGNYPVIASTSVKAYHNKYKALPPVITTGRSGSLGTVLFTNKKAWPLNTTLYVKNVFGNSPILIYFTLKLLELQNFNSGAGVPTLNRNHLNYLNIVVPPRSIQDLFDESLLRLFEKKESLQKSNDLLTDSRTLLLSRLISGKLSVDDLDIQFPQSMEEAGA